MEKWHQSLRQDRGRKTRDTHNPSFSSTLLDAIYRSIDEAERGRDRDGVVFYRSEEIMRRKQQQYNHKPSAVCGNGVLKEVEEEQEMAGLRRAIMIEKWMEKKVTEKLVVSRSSAVTPAPEDFDGGSRRRRAEFPLVHSSSSSSESSCGGGFSSSEAESMYGANVDFRKPPPKPIRTSTKISPAPPKNDRSEKPRRESKAFDREKSSGGSSQKKENAKAKALKMYGDLKKVKQPISPGAKLAGFLNSLFSAAGNAKKKTKTSPSTLRSIRTAAVADDSSSERTFKSAHASTCSSASSFSRSCLSKTPSSTAAVSRKLSSGAAGNNPVNATGKRSVRFYPVSVIVDEDSRPCGHKNVYGDLDLTPAAARNSVGDELKCRIRERNRRVEESARELLMKAHHHHHHLKKDNSDEDEEDQESDTDDAASCASSDLFELDNLSAIGNERYHEELPVYGTTHLERNRAAIATSLVL